MHDQGTTCPSMLTIDETAQLMTELGYPVSSATLRLKRREWIAGQQWGPTPLLLSRRRLRYERTNVIETVRELIAAARRRAADG